MIEHVQMPRGNPGSYSQGVRADELIFTCGRGRSPHHVPHADLRGASMRIEHAELTFLNLPMAQPELWAWGRRDTYTVGLVELHTDTGVVGLGEVVVAMGPDANVIRAIFEQMADVFRRRVPLCQ